MTTQTSYTTKIAAGIVAMSVALASIIFMGLVFYVETQGRGILYIEPNRMIAFSELLVTAFGFTATFMVFVSWITMVQKPQPPRHYKETEDLSE